MCTYFPLTEKGGGAQHQDTHVHTWLVYTQAQDTRVHTWLVYTQAERVVRKERDSLQVSHLQQRLPLQEEAVSLDREGTEMALHWALRGNSSSPP